MTLRYNVPEAEYRALPGAHQSSLWTIIERSPAHYHYEEAHPIEATPAMRFGAAFHAWILERETFPSRFIVAAEKFDRRTNAGKAAAAAFEAEAAGRIVLAEAEMDTIHAMAEAVLYHDDARGFMEQPGEPEVSVFWKACGIPCKGRIDRLVGNRLILDLKTCEEAKRGPFERRCASYGYFMQAAFYADALAALGVVPLPPLFIAVEKAPPYVCAVHQVGTDALDAGRAQYVEALRRLAECEKSGRWPGYEGISLLNPSKWAKNESIFD